MSVEWKAGQWGDSMVDQLVKQKVDSKVARLAKKKVESTADARAWKLAAWKAD